MVTDDRSIGSSNGGAVCHTSVYFNPKQQQCVRSAAAVHSLPAYGPVLKEKPIDRRMYLR